jgi:hypothetical protein
MIFLLKIFSNNDTIEFFSFGFAQNYFNFKTLQTFKESKKKQIKTL